MVGFRFLKEPIKGLGIARPTNHAVGLIGKAAGSVDGDSNVLLAPSRAVAGPASERRSHT